MSEEWKFQQEYLCQPSPSYLVAFRTTERGDVDLVVKEYDERTARYYLIRGYTVKILEHIRSINLEGIVK